jgi:cation:H+ antiporter
VVLASGLLVLGKLGRNDGVVMLIALALALAAMLWSAVHASLSDPLVEDLEEAEAEIPELSLPTAIGVLCLGLVLLIAGSRALVYGATVIARFFDVPELVIGLTVVAIGTSLPELAASVAGARRGHPELALGNIIGSNVFNALGVLAMPALIAPGSVDRAAVVRDVPVMVFLSVLLFVVAFSRHDQARIDRRAGVALVACFVAYQIMLYLGVGNPAPRP